MRTSDSSTASKPQQVNGLRNTAIPTSHRPQPCPSSTLNQTVRSEEAPTSTVLPYNWPTDVVFVTQNLTAPSIPDYVATAYILGPQESVDPSAPSGQDEEQHAEDGEAATPASTSQAATNLPSHLPRATHDPALSAYHPLYTKDLTLKIPVHIHPIDRQTPYCAFSFHAKSRNLTCHPALGSYGLFAGDVILPNTFLRPYLGVLHLKGDSDDRSEYDLTLTHDPRLPFPPHQVQADGTQDGIQSLQAQGQNIYIDSRHWANETRFINDYRGIAERPNVEFRSFIQRQQPHPHSEQDQHQANAQTLKFQMGIWSLKPIKRGEELVINYSKTFWTQQHIVDQTRDLVARLEAEAQTQAEAKRLAALQTVDPIQARLDRSRNRISQARPPFRPPPRQT